MPTEEMREFLKSLYGDRAIVIAGPCSAESEPQTLATAAAVSSTGVQVFRAGLWKPRTHPGGFEGVGVQGLDWLARARRETGMLVATEVATPAHAETAINAGIDLLWVGARTTGSPFAVQQLADSLRGHDIPLLVKNPPNPDLELWIGAMQRFSDAGLGRIGAIHRGFTPTNAGGEYRNPPHWGVAIELKRRLPSLCILCDPSHIGGRSEMVGAISQQALDMGFDGLFIEVHSLPGQALSDARQQLSPDQFKSLARSLRVRHAEDAQIELQQLRQRIDECDRELVSLLAQRMSVAREIGQFKRRHHVPVVQSSRFDAVLRRAESQARAEGLSEAFVRRLMLVVHEEAVRQQV